MLTDHIRTPRTPLAGTALRDFADFLAEGRTGTVDYADLAQLILNGERYNADPRGVAAARERLTAAVERGNATAANYLAEIAQVTR